MFVEKHYRTILVGIWLLASALLILVAWTPINDWKMGDPDDQLRLVQVRDWLAGQSWWDVTQFRMNPPDGGPMHWSRLVDIPLGLSIIVLTPVFGQALAEHITAVLVPLLTFGIIIALMASITRRHFGEKAALVAAAAPFVLLPITVQVLPMRIDHHGWQIVLFLVALRSAFDLKSPVRGAIVTGLALAAWVEISIEGLPFAALFMALFGLRWLTGEQGRDKQFAYGLASLAVSSLLIFMATEPPNWALNYCDEMSPVHIWAFSAAALVSVVATLASSRIPSRFALAFKLAAGGVAAAAAVAVLLAVAPQCAGDAFANLDPLVRTYWYNRVLEGLPLYAQPFSFVAQEVAGLAVSLIGVVAMFRRKEGPAKVDRIGLALLFAGCALVGIQVARAAVYALAMSIIFMAPLVIDLFTKAEGHKGIATRNGLRLLACMLILPGVLGTNAANVMARLQQGDAKAVADKEAQMDLARKCQAMEYIQPLDRLTPSQFMAGLDVSPGILQFTRHKVVATGHHRNQVAMKDVILAYTQDPETARAIFTKRGIEYLVSCDGSFELLMYRRNAPQGLYARLEGGEQFPWLVRQPDIGPYHLWRVIPEGRVEGAGDGN